MILTLTKTTGNRYIDTITEKCLLGGGSEALLARLTKILDLIVRFRNTQDMLYNSIEEEQARLDSIAAENAKRAADGNWGRGGSDDSDTAERVREIAANASTQLRSISKEYEKLFFVFLESLSKSPSSDLRFLSFRLDFNEHYARRVAEENATMRQAALEDRARLELRRMRKQQDEVDARDDIASLPIKGGNTVVDRLR